MNVFLKLQIGGVVNIKDWLREKGPSLEVALNLRQGLPVRLRPFTWKMNYLDVPMKPCRLRLRASKGGDEEFNFRVRFLFNILRMVEG